MAVIGVLVFLLMGFLAVWPVSRAFRLGVDAAWNPDARLTPQSPWVFFRRRAWKAIRWWVVAWGLVLLLAAYPGFASSQRVDYPILIRIVASIILPSILLSFLLFAVLNNLLLANRVRHHTYLPVLVLGLALAEFVGFTFAAGTLPPERWRVYQWSNATGSMAVSYNLFFVWVAAAAILMTVAGLLYVWSKGDRWFLFPE